MDSDLNEIGAIYALLKLESTYSTRTCNGFNSVPDDLMPEIGPLWFSELLSICSSCSVILLEAVMLSFEAITTPKLF